MLEGFGLRKRYGDVVAVDGIDLVVRPGEVVGLLGPNGAGKSTAFAMLAGLMVPDGGRVLLDGVDITRDSLAQRARRGLGYLPQHASVFPRLSALQNVVLASGSVAVAQECLRDAGLLVAADRPAGELSGGQRRRLEIARCLALEPRVILLDEPYAGLDPAHLSGVRAQIRKLASRGIGILLTDQSVREALGTCDRATILDAGIVQVEGTPSEVAAAEHVRSRYLGHDFCV